MAYAFVKERARAILHQHPSLTEFCMGMGGWHFRDKQDRLQTADELKYLEPFDKLIYKLEGLGCKPCGNPVRFTTNGPEITDW